MGYAGFAHTIADAIPRIQAPEGVVLAIYGPWGSGKTSILNFIRKRISENEHSTLAIIQFNPWWITGHDDLARAFIKQVVSELSLHQGWRSDSAKQTLSKLIGLGNAMSGVAPEPARQIISTLLNKAKTSIEKEKSIPGLKKDLVDSLRSQKSRVLVIVDDIDRLAKEEIRQVFQVVKALGDVPGFVYLMAFDREIVAGALDEMHNGDGLAYLDKIIQAPFELPLPDSFGLELMLKAKLDQVFSAAPHAFLGKDRWSELWRSGLQQMIKTPRDVVRLSNALGVTFLPVAEAVNPIDYAGIEALRVFAPATFRRISALKVDLLAAQSPAGTPMFGRISKPDDLISFLCADVKDNLKPSVIGIIKQLFPGLDSSQMMHGAIKAQHGLELRISSELSFDSYFRFSIPKGMSGIWLRNLVSSIGNSKPIDGMLRDTLSMDTVADLPASTECLSRLDEFVRHENILDERGLQTVFSALFSAGDELALDSVVRGRPEIAQNDTRVLFVAMHVLGRLESRQREALLQLIFLDSTPKALSCAVMLVVELAQQHGLHGQAKPLEEAERLVSRPLLDRLEAQGLQWIRDQSSSIALAQRIRLPLLLMFWQDLAGTPEVLNWVEKVTKTDNDLLRFLSIIHGNTPFYTDNLESGALIHRLNPQDLEIWLPMDTTADRLLKLINDRNSSSFEAAARQYLLEYSVARYSGNVSYAYNRNLQSLADAAKVKTFDAAGIRTLVSTARASVSAKPATSELST